MTRQVPPKPDVDFLVHKSSVFYIAEPRIGSAGYTWYLNDGAHRVIRSDSTEQKFVQYKYKSYTLFDKNDLIQFLEICIGGGHAVHVGLLALSDASDISKVTPYPFIDISSPVEQKEMRKLSFYWKDKFLKS